MVRRCVGTVARGRVTGRPGMGMKMNLNQITFHLPTTSQTMTQVEVEI
jgi:hypothetical protein